MHVQTCIAVVPIMHLSMRVIAPREHSAILFTFIKLPFVVKAFVLSVFGWPF